MKRMTLTTAALLWSGTALASGHADTEAIVNAVKDDLADSYSLSEFEKIEIRIRRNTVVVEAEGDDAEVERTYELSDGALGDLIRGEEEVERNGVEIERVFSQGSWIEEIEDDRDDDDDDDDDRDDDDDDDRDDDDDDDDRSGRDDRDDDDDDDRGGGGRDDDDDDDDRGGRGGGGSSGGGGGGDDNDDDDDDDD